MPDRTGAYDRTKEDESMWEVCVETAGVPGGETIEVDDAMDWYVVAMAGERAMAASSNGSCTVHLARPGQGESVMVRHPKGRDSERRAWAMVSVVTEMKAAVEA